MEKKWQNREIFCETIFRENFFLPKNHQINIKQDLKEILKMFMCTSIFFAPSSVGCWFPTIKLIYFHSEVTFISTTWYFLIQPKFVYRESIDKGKKITIPDIVVQRNCCTQLYTTFSSYFFTLTIFIHAIKRKFTGVVLNFSYYFSFIIVYRNSFIPSFSAVN